jgi:O-antigen/teichoic acid export membrane protein
MGATLSGWAARARGRSTFAVGVTTLAGGTAASQAILILVSPLLTRLYQPDDLGGLGLFVSLLGLGAVATSLRYERAIASAADGREAAGLALISLALIAPTSILATLFALALAQGSLFGLQGLPPLVIAGLAPALALSGVGQVLRNWLIREQSFGTLAQLQIRQSVARSILQVGLGVASTGMAGLVVGDMLGRAVGIARPGLDAWRAGRQRLPRLEKAHLASVMRRYAKFPLLAMPSSLIDALAAVLPVPLIAQLYGLESAGLFVLVQRVLAVPVQLFGTSVGDVFHGRLATYAREMPEHAMPLLAKTGLLLAALALPPLVIVVLAGPDLFRLLFGSAWTGAGLLAAAVVPWTFGQLVVSPLSRAVFVYQGQEAKLAFDIARLVAVVSVILAAHGAGADVVRAVTLLSIVQALAYGVYLGLLVRLVRRGLP